MNNAKQQTENNVIVSSGVRLLDTHTSIHIKYIYNGWFMIQKIHIYFDPNKKRTTLWDII